MKPTEIRKARQKLGLSLDAMAHMLGYEGENARSMMHHLETGKRPLRPAQQRLLRFYMDGIRPKDWPNDN